MILTLAYLSFVISLSLYLERDVIDPKERIRHHLSTISAIIGLSSAIIILFSFITEIPTDRVYKTFKLF